MIATLFESNETSFNTNGLGRLPDAIKGTVHEVLNGAFDLTIVYPVDGLHASDITVNRLIKVKANDDSTSQTFRIYKVQKSSDNKRITVSAHHISYDMNGYPVPPCGASSRTVSDIIALINSVCLSTSPFIINTDLTSTISYQNKFPQSLRGCLMAETDSIAAVTGCEFQFNDMIVNCLAHRGSDNGVTIRYGKNLESFVSVKTTESAYNGSIAYWENQGTVVYGTVQRVTGANFPTDKILIIDASDDFDTQPTSGQLDTFASNYNTENNLGQSGIETVTVSFVPLWQTEEYKDIARLEQVLLGDTVHVVYDMNTYDLRMVEYEYDYIGERYISTTLGAKKITLYEAINKVVKR